MKTKVFLDKHDIQRIIAKHYNVEQQKVDMHLFITTEGYGMDEHDAPAIEAIVTTGGEIQEGL